jgi:tetratricopeptide (TPR) repeat protein
MGRWFPIFFAKHIGTFKKKEKVQEGMVYPKTLAKEIADLRMYPEEVNAAHILPFMPAADKIDQDKEKQLHTFAKIFSQSVSIHAVSTYLVENTDWDFSAVYFDNIDHYCHGFMKYHPPKMKGVNERDFEIYKDVVTSGYRFQDMMLERLLKLAGEDTTVIIMSDHGFKSQSDRSRALPKNYPAAPALDHAQFGILAMKGPGIKKDGSRLFGASLLDITPTILTLFGLPVGRDMNGKVLTDCFQDDVQPQFIESWEDVEGDFGEHDTTHLDTVSSNEAISQLVELGYIEKPDEDKTKQVERTKADLRYNLARVHIGKKEYREAEELLKGLVKEDASRYYCDLDLVLIYLNINEYDNARVHMEALRKSKSTQMVNLNLIEAKILLGENKVLKAIPILERLAKQNLTSSNVAFELGKAYLQVENYTDAEKTFRDALKLNTDFASAHQALAVACLRQDKVEEAIDAALRAVELIRNFPKAHYTLGEALERGGYKEEAKAAFEMALHLNKGMERAKTAIAKMEKQQTVSVPNEGKRSSYVHHENEITIVSGLPRSGTSMMMQMLHEGGMEMMTDELREANTHNPKGYYELEAVKSLRKESKWLGNAKGKGLKVIVQLLRYLPSNYRYKVIFMHRDLDEVLRSQQIMLGRSPENYPIALANSFKNELQQLLVWEKKEPGVQVLHLHYKEVLANPEKSVYK